MTLRSTFADISALQYRIKAAATLLGVSENTMRGYADNAGIQIKRASDINPGAPSVRVFDIFNIFEIAQWRRSVGYTKAPALTNGPKVITIDVIKGGTGKTTTAIELAVHLSLLGLRVLVIDVDVQANATQLMGYEPDLSMDEAAQFDLSEEAIIGNTLSAALLPYLDSKARVANSSRPTPVPTIIKKPFGEHGPHLVPADTFAGEIEQALANSRGNRELYIKQMLEAAKNGEVPGLDTRSYDVIIFDCPPNISYTSTAALAAADYVIAPIRMDAFSIKGLTRLMGEIEGLERDLGVRSDLIILPTYYAAQIARIGRMQTQLNHYRTLLAGNTISASEEFPKSLDNYLPLTLQKPTSNAAAEYRVFATEIFDKIIGNADKKGRAGE